VANVNEILYRTPRIAVRQTLGKGTLEEALAEKTDLDETVAAEVRGEPAVYRVRVGAIRLKDIILPGGIRDILNQVVTAEKQAQANLIRSREETAATRSPLNTARLMEDNPLLVRRRNWRRWSRSPAGGEDHRGRGSEHVAGADGDDPCGAPSPSGNTCFKVCHRQPRMRGTTKATPDMAQVTKSRSTASGRPA
jgi:hypothetical protein